MTKSYPLFSNLLDPKLENVFVPLCQNIPIIEIKCLIKQVISHNEKVHAALATNEFIDVEISEKITKVLINLLNEMDVLPDQSRQLLVGAGKYFICDHDAQADFGSILGFDDDVDVLNYVLIEIGREDLKVEF